MNWTMILKIAKTHLLTKKRQTIIAALGVTFGIGSYITLVSFMTGLNGMLDDMILNQTPHIHLYNEIRPSVLQPLDYLEDSGLTAIRSVRPKQRQKRIHNALALLKHLSADQDVKAALPKVEAQVFYISGPIELGGVVHGIDVIQEVNHYNFKDYIVNGTYQDLAQTPNSILLGAGIAQKMSLDVGDRIRLSTIDGNVFSLKIIGLFQSGIADLDAVQSYTNIKTAQRLLGETNMYITAIDIKLHDMHKATSIAQSLEQQFGLRAVDINTANAQFETGTTIRNLITYAVSFTLLLVAGFGIYNILNMLIYEKMNDIAILKATGFSSSDVHHIFVSQAIIIGLIGGILGLALGLGLSMAIDQTPFDTSALPTVTTYPINHKLSYYLIGLGFALFATFLAGLLPARKAGKMDPVHIIRGQ